jgi:NADH-quinone oxidoreductase subunit J
LLYFILSLISLAVIFYTVGAHFAAALEVIVYAGAIMVMYVFVAMMLNLGKATEDQERAWLKPTIWIGPSLMAAPLLAQLVLVLQGNVGTETAMTVLGAKQVGIALFGPYVLAVELASMLLLAGLIGAYHLARK